MSRPVWGTIALLLAMSASSYPLDAYDVTGIRRLEYNREVVLGRLSGNPVPLGARLPLSVIAPRLDGESVTADFDAPDPDLGRAIARALGADAPKYSVSVLDLTDPHSPVYAEHNGGLRVNVGSVGKVLVALGWFQAMADVYPHDIGAREQLLRNTIITGDEFIISDHHEVRFYDVDTGQRSFRRIQIGDHGSLWEWLDWMLSASNNSAAATIQKQLILLKAFGDQYPPSPAEERVFFDETPRNRLSELFVDAMVGSASRNGIDTDLFRQGSFFTRHGKNRVAGVGSIGNPREIVKLLYRLERGEVVDFWSSRELKRLLYMTERRIRYASHPALNDYAVYFKSGSLYSCEPEPGFVCRKYEGNKINLLASIAIVEGPVRAPRYHYLVAVSSNVLRQNSAVAHQTLAMRIHRLIEARHAAPSGAGGSVSDGGGDAPSALPFAGATLIGDAAGYDADRAPEPAD